MTNKKFILLIFILSLVLACSDESRYGKLKKVSKGEAYQGGIFRMNETEGFRNLFPLGITELTSRHIAGQVYEGLVKLNQKDLSPMPALAEKWIVNADATSFIFFIRKGVKFHDDKAFPGGKGRELTAHDIKYCFDQLCTDSPQNLGFWVFQDRVVGANQHYNLSKEGNQPKGGVSGVKVLNKHAIQIDLKYPSPGFLEILSTPYAWIYPREAKEFYQDKLAEHCIGTGPFKTKKVSKGKSVLLVANKNYWGTDKQGNKLPYLAALKFSFQDDKEREMRDFEKRKLEMVFGSGFDGQACVLDSQGHYIEQNTPALSVLYYGFQNQGKIFSNKNLRLAINHAINRKTIVDEVLKGKGIPANGGIIPPAFSAYGPMKIKGYDFNPEKARNYLRAAGYPGGEGLPEIQLLINDGGRGNNILIAEAISKMLEENLNIKLKIEILPFKDLLEQVETGGADFFKSSWIADYPDPENFLTILKSTHLKRDSAGHHYLNTTRYVNLMFDSLVKMGQKEPAIESKYTYFTRAEQLMIDDAPIIPILYHMNSRLVQKYVRNFPVNGMEYRDFSRVWIDKRDFDKVY